MKKLYKVTIGKRVNVLLGGLMSFGFSPQNFEHKMVVQMWEVSESDVHRKVRDEYKEYNIVKIDKL